MEEWVVAAIQNTGWGGRRGRRRSGIKMSVPSVYVLMGLTL